MVSTKLSPHSAILLVLLVCMIAERGYGKNADLLHGSRYQQQNASTSCIEAERQALLRFKDDLLSRKNVTADDPLPSWGSGDDKRDCCKWEGVLCADDSGHVVSLFLHSLDSKPLLMGNLSLSLFELRHLNSLSLSSMSFGGSRIPSSIGMLSQLTELTLTENGLIGELPKELGNLSRLETLYLESNDLHGSIPQTFSKLTSLKELHLAGNRLSGSIPDIFGNMSELGGLSLDHNMLEGELPRSIWNLSSLTYLTLSENKLHGHLPEAISQLNLLQSFGISNNLLEGKITDAHFKNLSLLTFLDLSSNSLSLNFHPNWTPPFRLNVISLDSCKLGPRFPKWLQTQTNFSFLSISNSGISDSIPNWFWLLSSNYLVINLSHNQIFGRIENHNISLQAGVVDLSSNQLEGSIPLFFTQISSLILFRNRFSTLNLSCYINNEISLALLDISNNKLSGELPDNWSSFKYLQALDLSSNNLHGRVPSSIFSPNMRLVKLSKNNFSGDLPWIVQSCTNLLIIDFGENKLSGTIPAWLGKKTPELIILSLRLNSLDGGIPSSLCHLSNLTILDLSSNNIVGSIPRCIRSFGAMKRTQILGLQDSKIRVGTFILASEYSGSLFLAWKGKSEEFKNTLGLVRSIDLSSNKLSGEIPTEISALSQLVSLNLSTNSLSGPIPAEIGRLKSLDALDLSRNRLIGEIPQSLAQIDRLNTLDLSNNNLSGKIPTSTQLQSFENAYWGNTKLCGNPLPNKCPIATSSNLEVTNEDSDELIGKGFYISMLIGFTTVFWGVCGVLIFKKSFRYAYFKLFNEVGDCIYEKTAIQCAKVMRMIKG